MSLAFVESLGENMEGTDYLCNLELCYSISENVLTTCIKSVVLHKIKRFILFGILISDIHLR